MEIIFLKEVDEFTIRVKMYNFWENTSYSYG